MLEKKRSTNENMIYEELILIIDLLKANRINLSEANLLLDVVMEPIKQLNVGSSDINSDINLENVLAKIGKLLDEFGKAVGEAYEEISPEIKAGAIAALDKIETVYDEVSPKIIDGTKAVMQKTVRACQNIISSIKSRLGKN